MTIGAFIVTYSRPKMLQTSIGELLAQTRPPDEILVVDNGQTEETARVVAGFSNPMIRYERTGSNLGSAGGFEYGTRRILELGHDFIVFGDDDNPPRARNVYEKLIKLLERSEPSVAAVGAVGARWNESKGELVRFRDQALDGVLEVDFIGSGHDFIIRRQAVEEVGPPDGSLFFGYPDLQYCLRIRKAGFKMLVDGELMRHYRKRSKRDNLEIRKSVIPRGPQSSVWRNYYTTRNYIYMMRKNFDRPDLARREVFKASVRTLGAWMRGVRYGATFTRHQLKGVIDGYRGIRGMTVQPMPK